MKVELLPFDQLSSSSIEKLGQILKFDSSYLPKYVKSRLSLDGSSLFIFDGNDSLSRYKLLVRSIIKSSDCSKLELVTIFKVNVDNDVYELFLTSPAYELIFNELLMRISINEKLFLKFKMNFFDSLWQLKEPYLSKILPLLRLNCIPALPRNFDNFQSRLADIGIINKIILKFRNDEYMLINN